MNIKVRLHPALSERIGSSKEIEADGKTIGQCLKNAALKFPELDKILWPENDHLNPAILIFFQDRVIRGEELNRIVTNGDFIDIIPAISGG